MACNTFTTKLFQIYQPSGKIRLKHGLRNKLTNTIKFLKFGLI